MAKTLNDLQVLTRIYLDEAQQADFLTTEVNYAINFAYQDLAGSVMEVKEEYYQTLTPFSYAVIANQQEYTIDSSLIKVNRVEINYTPGQANAQPLKAFAIKMDEMLINLSNTSTNSFYGNAGYYLHGDIGNQAIGFIPIPTIADTGGSKSIRVWGIALPSDLVNLTDTVNIPYADRWTYLIAIRAAAQLLSKGQQEEVIADKYLARYEMGVIKLKNFLSVRQEDGAEVVQNVDVEDVDFGFPI